MGKFEENWKEVFEGTEVSPADSVWINIDRDLANAEGAAMKKRLVLYQRIAAASVLFALLIGSLGIYYRGENKSQPAQNIVSENNLPLPADENTVTGERNPKANATVYDGKEESNAANQPTEKGEIISSSKPNPRLIFGKADAKLRNSNLIKVDGTGFIDTQAAKIPVQFYITAQKKGVQVENKVTHVESMMAELPEAGLLPIPEIQDGPIIAEIVRKLPAIPGAFLARKENKMNHEQLWASVTAGTGNFSASTNPNSSLNYAASGQMAATSNSSVGSSVSFGMLGGVRLTKRFVVQSGIQYLNQSVNSTSNISTSNALAAVASSLYNKTMLSYNTTSPYAVNSANEFVSVPVQAGYLFIDKKMGLQLNSGVSTDFFIRNTLSDPSGQRQSFSQGAGQDSPYRSVNFSGLVSSEVSCKLGNRYRISLVPGIRYSFNSVLKSAANSSISPLLWDLGFRFRYIFR